MSLFHKFGPCRGITLFRFKGFQIELWYFPKHYTIKEHQHPSQKIEVMYLFGESWFCQRDLATKELKKAFVWWPFQFSKFSVYPTHSHWFEVGNKPLIALNIERWINGIKPTSASVDFKYI